MALFCLNPVQKGFDEQQKKNNEEDILGIWTFS